MKILSPLKIRGLNKFFSRKSELSKVISRRRRKE
jgi:hypothetical protein